MTHFTLCSEEEAKIYLDIANDWIVSKQRFFLDSHVAAVAEFLANQAGKTLYKHFANDQ